MPFATGGVPSEDRDGEGGGGTSTAEGSFSTAKHRHSHHRLGSPETMVRVQADAVEEASGEGEGKVHGGSLRLSCLRRSAAFLCVLAAVTTCALRYQLTSVSGGEGGGGGGGGGVGRGDLSELQTKPRSGSPIRGSEDTSSAPAGESFVPLTPAELARYGNEPRLGTSPFVQSEGCRSRSAEGSGGTVQLRPCLSYHPVYDLSLLVKTDEASEWAAAAPPKPPPASVTKRQEPIVGTDAAPVPEDVGFASGTVSLLTRRGYGLGHDINQDRGVVVSPFLPFAGIFGRGESGFLIGVFDGHGTQGQKTAHHAVEAVPREVAKALLAEQAAAASSSSALGSPPSPTDEQVKRALTNAFLEADRTVPDVPTSGCTASVALRLGGKLYVANVGDSLTFVAAYDPSTSGGGRGSGAGAVDATRIVYSTRADKPHLPEERSRIEDMGGQVYLPPPWIPGDSSRVVAPVDEGLNGLMDTYALAMSRSFGDREVRKVGVVAKPIVDVLDVGELRRNAKGGLDADAGMRAGVVEKESGGGNEHTDADADRVELFVVSVTDGLFDRIPAHAIANRLAESLYGGEEAKDHPLEVCEKLIFEASRMWLHAVQVGAYRDDITIAVSKVT